MVFVRRLTLHGSHISCSRSQGLAACIAIEDLQIDASYIGVGPTADSSLMFSATYPRFHVPDPSALKHLKVLHVISNKYVRGAAGGSNLYTLPSLEVLTLRTTDMDLNIDRHLTL